MSRYYQNICKIKDILIKNDYSETFVNKYVNTFLNELFIPKRIVQTAENQRSLFNPIWAISR